MTWAWQMIEAYFKGATIISLGYPVSEIEFHTWNHLFQNWCIMPEKWCISINISMSNKFYIHQALMLEYKIV